MELTANNGEERRAAHEWGERRSMDGDASDGLSGGRGNPSALSRFIACTSEKRTEPRDG